MPQLVSHGPHETPGEGSCVSVSRRGFRTNNPKVVELSTLLGDNDSRQKRVPGVPPAKPSFAVAKKTPMSFGDGRIFDPSGRAVSPAY